MHRRNKIAIGVIGWYLCATAKFLFQSSFAFSKLPEEHCCNFENNCLVQYELCFRIFQPLMIFDVDNFPTSHSNLNKKPSLWKKLSQILNSFYIECDLLNFGGNVTLINNCLCFKREQSLVKQKHMHMLCPIGNFT